MFYIGSNSFWKSLVVVIISALACNKPKVITPPIIPDNKCIVNGVDTCTAPLLTATINLVAEKQTMHSFGASDCWNIKFVGKNWPLAKRNEIADLLFSKDFDAAGNPKGIGLSLWRINIGAGSYEQGDASKISSEWRREECFQDATGNYDWSKQAGNRWFAQAAKKRGVENLLLFSIAAPVHLSKNGLATGNPASAELGKLNLKADSYDEYADFMAEVAKNFTETGTKIDYISPVNEPNWNWTLNNSTGVTTQEGTSATNTEILQLIKELDAKITAKGLTTKITVCESGQHNYTSGLLSNNTARSDYFNYFWNPSSSGYIGNLPNVEKVISSHSYFSQNNINNLISSRLNLNNRISSINNGIKFWQTEYCILNNEDGTEGNVRDLGITSALYIARVIHSDLTLANATSWQWWLGVSPGDYKDGLVYISDINGNMGALPATKNDGTIYRSKMLWAMGNFSRFIRPGMIRVDASLQKYTDNIAAATGVMLSAYKNPVTKQLVMVLVNITSKDEKIAINGVNFTPGSLKTYTTSSANEMKYNALTAADKITIGAKSIVTIVGNYQ